MIRGESAKGARKEKVISRGRKPRGKWAPDWELREGGTPFPSSRHKSGALYELNGWIGEEYYF